MINLSCPNCNNCFSDDDCVFDDDETQCPFCDTWSYLYHNDDGNLNHASHMWLVKVEAETEKMYWAGTE